MPPIKKRKAQPAPQTERSIPALALSIHEFAAAHNLSIDSYFRMARAGIGPQTMKIGARTLISIESAADWRRERERATHEGATERQAGARVKPALRPPPSPDPKAGSSSDSALLVVDLPGVPRPDGRL
jgi:hypothetical protein